MSEADLNEDLLRFDYEQTAETFRLLVDIRFKLLTLVPALSGAAIAILSKDLAAPLVSPESVLVVGILGFVVTLGVTFYDQRNSQISNETFFRLRRLETVLGFPSRVLDHRGGGLYTERPGRILRFLGIWKIWHDRGLALIYGAVLGAWVFPITYAMLAGLGRGSHSSPTNATIAAGVAAVAALGFIAELHRLDRSASASAKASGTDAEDTKRSI